MQPIRRSHPSNAVFHLLCPFNRDSSESVVYAVYIYKTYLLSVFSLFFFLSFRQILFSVIETRKFSIALLATDCLLCNETLVIYQSDFIFRSSDLTSAFYSRCTVGKSFIILSLYFSSLPKFSIHLFSRDHRFEIERFKFRRKFSKIEKFVSIIEDNLWLKIRIVTYIIREM